MTRKNPAATVSILVLAACCAAVALGAQGPPSTAPPPTVHQVAETVFQQYKLPGLAVAVAKRGEIVYSGTFGQADLEHGVAVTAETRFRVGSLSKLLTVAAVARLHQEGKLDLDADVRSYVPYFPEKEWPLTTRQLASHTAGIRHYASKDQQVVLMKFLANPPKWTSVEESLSIFMDDPLVFQPGTAYAYSSYGYNLISAVVEGASGQPFLDYMAAQVLAPLGLRATTADDRTAIVAHRTRFYYANPETGEVIHDAPVDNSYKWASGGFLSSAHDLVRLGTAFLEPGFFQAATLAAVFAPQPHAEHRGTKVGLGWRIEEDEAGRILYHHGGSIAGGRAFILMLPAEQVVVALLANSYAHFGKAEALSLAAPFR